MSTATKDSRVVPTIAIGHVSDDALNHAALRQLLLNQQGASVAWSAFSAEEAAAALIETPVDVVVLDLRTEDSSWTQAQRTIIELRPATKILLLGARVDPRRVPTGPLIGVDGYLCKEDVSEMAETVIRLVSLGAFVISPSAYTRIDVSLLSNESPLQADNPLTPREMEVARLISESLTNSQIARRMSISVTTVKAHVSSILTKLGTRDRVGIARWFYLLDQPTVPSTR